MRPTILISHGITISLATKSLIAWVDEDGHLRQDKGCKVQPDLVANLSALTLSLVSKERLATGTLSS
jgi:hypothetical protein